jgi:hypothetical protein
MASGMAEVVIAGIYLKTNRWIRIDYQSYPNHLLIHPDNINADGTVSGR